MSLLVTRQLFIKYNTRKLAVSEGLLMNLAVPSSFVEHFTDVVERR